MLLHLSGPAAAAHTDILQRAAKSGGFVPFEVVQTDKDVRVHDGPADLGLLHKLTASHGYVGLICSFQTVCNDDVTACGEHVEPVLKGCTQMLQGILSSAHVQRVAVCKEGAPSQLFDDIRHSLGIVGTQVGQIARLAKMDLDGRHFLLEINVPDARLSDKFLELSGKVRSGKSPKVREIHFCFFHVFLLFIYHFYLYLFS